MARRLIAAAAFGYFVRICHGRIYRYYVTTRLTYGQRTDGQTDASVQIIGARREMGVDVTLRYMFRPIRRHRVTRLYEKHADSGSGRLT